MTDIPFLEDIAGLMHKLVQADGQKFIEIVLQYFLEKGEIHD